MSKKEQASENHEQGNSSLGGVNVQLCDNLDENYKCKNMCLTRCVEDYKFYK